MLHRIREAMSDRGFGFSKIGSGDGGKGGAEADETFVGGRAEFIHKRTSYPAGAQEYRE
jgi:hypothetical protein